MIFDVDYALTDTENQGHRITFNQDFQYTGIDWKWDVPLYQGLLSITGGKRRIEYYLDKYLTSFERQDNFLDFIEYMHKSKSRYYTYLLAEGAIPLRQGVRPLIS